MGPKCLHSVWLTKDMALKDIWDVVASHILNMKIRNLNLPYLAKIIIHTIYISMQASTDTLLYALHCSPMGELLGKVPYIPSRNCLGKEWFAAGSYCILEVSPLMNLDKPKTP